MIHDHAISKAEAKLKARIRHYPKFTEGMTPSQYVHAYYGINSMRWVQVQFGIQRGAYTPDAEYERLHKQVNDFFAPLSTIPMFSQDDTVIEEVLV